MEPRRTTVFGGTGFLGRRIVKSLVERGHRVRVASRHPDRSRKLFSAPDGAIGHMQANVNKDTSVAEAVSGATAVVNAVSLYVERGGATFRSVHVDAAARVAEQARIAGVHRLVHISGIGADPASGSPYIRSRGDGENAVQERFRGATIIRPAVMVGVGDSLITPLAGLLRKLPVLPEFGRGRTRLQPVAADDVALAIAVLLDAQDPQQVYEFGGPRIYTYDALLRAIRDRLGRPTALVPLPFGIWQLLAWVAERLPKPPITRNQVELMRRDNVANSSLPGFETLGITPASLDELLPEILRHR